MSSTSGRDDSDLISRFMAGDQSVLEDLLRVVVPAVRGGLRREFAGQLDYHELQDVVIVGVRKLWKARLSYDPARASLETLLYRIAHNEAVDMLRRRRLRPVPIGDRVVYGDVSPSAARNGDDASDAPRSKLMSDLDTCLKLLSEPERKILLADANSHDDVANSRTLARELGMSVSGVRVKRKRALAKLRELLDSLGHSLGY
jgi:RNA polymerase sigma factor (sigma-70 family)